MHHDVASSDTNYEQAHPNDRNLVSSAHTLASSRSSGESAASLRSSHQVSHPTAQFCQDFIAQSCQDHQGPVTKKRRFPRLGQNLDGSRKFRLIVKSCRKKVFLRRLHAAEDLDDDFLHSK